MSHFTYVVVMKMLQIEFQYLVYEGSSYIVLAKIHSSLMQMVKRPAARKTKHLVSST